MMGDPTVFCSISLYSDELFSHLYCACFANCSVFYLENNNFCVDQALFNFPYIRQVTNISIGLLIPIKSGIFLPYYNYIYVPAVTSPLNNCLCCLLKQSLKLLKLLYTFYLKRTKGALALF